MSKPLPYCLVTHYKKLEEDLRSWKGKNIILCTVNAAFKKNKLNEMSDVSKI